MDPCNPKQTYSVVENHDYASQIRPDDVEMGMDWAPASPEWIPSTEPGHPTGIAQRRPRPVGQFQNALVKPLMPFLNNLYLRAQRMQHLARNVSVFHMQSIYLARQALHLVIRLNDAVDVNEGPSDEQYDGRNDLEDELIELFEAMTEWGRDEFQYEQCTLKIKKQYALLFKDRFYFHDTRDGSTDPLYQKYVAYDERTIRYRQCPQTHVTSSTTVEINCWTEPLEEEGGSEDETGMLVDCTGTSASSARSKGSKGLAHQPSRRAPKSSFSVRNCQLKRKHREIATIRIHLAITHLRVAQIGVRKHGRRHRCQWEFKQRCQASAPPPLDPFTQPDMSPPVTNPSTAVDDIPPPSFAQTCPYDITSHELLECYRSPQFVLGLEHYESTRSDIWLGWHGTTKFDLWDQCDLYAGLSKNPFTHSPGQLAFPPPFNTIQQRQTRMDLQQAPFQFTNLSDSNTMPVNNRMSFLSQHFKSQGYWQTSDNPTVTSPVINEGSRPHSAGQARRPIKGRAKQHAPKGYGQPLGNPIVTSPIIDQSSFPDSAGKARSPLRGRARRHVSQGYGQSYGNPIVTSPTINQGPFPLIPGQAARSPLDHFKSTFLKTNEQDRYMPLRLDDDFELRVLSLCSLGPEDTSPTSDWPIGQNQVHSKQISVEVSPAIKFHKRRTRPSNTVPLRLHYATLCDVGATWPSGTALFDHVAQNFPPHQQQAAFNIFNYKQADPDTAIPASLITPHLAEVQDGRGWCLLGNCGVDRAKQKLNPHYDSSNDNTGKRLDHLDDHIRDKHFNYRPLRCATAPCAQTFSRERDLKRHEKTHTAASMACDVCGKHYTREDNLKRHRQLKHLSVPSRVFQRELPLLGATSNGPPFLFPPEHRELVACGPPPHWIDFSASNTPAHTDSY